MKKIYAVIFVFTLSVFLSAGQAAASIFATELVDCSASLNGSSMYKDPDNLLGEPTLLIAQWGGGTSHVSIVEPAYGANTLVTFTDDDWAVVKFDHQVEDDPNNPYGLDFTVFGNGMFAGSGFVYNDTDHRVYTLGNGNAAREPVMVSVSQDGENWYTYENGPYGDTAYPTNPWVWDPDLYDTTGVGWTDIKNDYTKPVDPSLTSTDFKGIPSYEAMLLYDGSAGGTAFDLAESGFEWIQYVKVSGISGSSLDGEIDAFADIAPVPVPAAVWLLGSGLLAMVGIRRKSRD